jgi:hypothetical protein
MRDIQNGKMPRRLLHATCGVRHASSGSSGSSVLPPGGQSSSPRSQIFDDFDSYTMDPMPSREESFG